MMIAGRRRAAHRRCAAPHDDLQVGEGEGGGLELHVEGGGGVLAPRVRARRAQGRGDGKRGEGGEVRGLSWFGWSGRGWLLQGGDGGEGSDELLGHGGEPLLLLLEPRLRCLLQLTDVLLQAGDPRLVHLVLPLELADALLRVVHGVVQVLAELEGVWRGDGWADSWRRRPCRLFLLEPFFLKLFFLKLFFLKLFFLKLFLRLQILFILNFLLDLNFNINFVIVKIIELFQIFFSRLYFTFRLGFRTGF